MKHDRHEMLRIFLENDELRKQSSLSDDELHNVNFSEDTGDLVVESLKSLLQSYCNGDPESFSLRRINQCITHLSE
jgi:hypothetical protein